MRSCDATLVLDAKAELGEGPVWDTRASCLYFVDILRGRVHRCDHASGPPPRRSDGAGFGAAGRIYEIGISVGAVAPTESGDLIMAVRDGFARLDPAAGTVRTVVAVEADRPANRMNDGKCDAAGRFWAGTMALDEQAGAGALYRLDPDGRVHTMVTGVTISNGIDWSDDDRLMYYIDSGTGSVDVFDFDGSDGSIRNRRTVVRIDESDGVPDGMTLDDEGHLWVALWGGGAVHRYSPDGRLDAIVRVPAPHVTCCAFGGADLRDLFITTATIKLSEAERAAQPQAGGLFRARPGVKGRPPNRFKG